MALAGVGGSDAEVIEEVSDLLYHVLVMLKARGLTLERVMAELQGGTRATAQRMVPLRPLAPTLRTAPPPDQRATVPGDIP